MDILKRDLTLAIRGMRQAPAFAAGVLVMLTLAIGAAIGAFSVVHAALLRPLPHVDLERWANLYERPINEGLGELSVSIPNYRDWKRDSRTFAEMVLWMPWSFNLAGDERAPERLRATIVTPNLFRALGLTAAAGRLLLDSDDPINGRLVLISDALWERRFARNPALIGQAILLNHVPFTVVGVAPPEFTFPVNTGVDVWIPESAAGIASAGHRDARGMQVSAMLRPGATWDEARAEMDVIASRLAAQFPENKGFGVSVVPMRESIAGDVRRPLLTLLGALALMLLLVSVNVANLQMVKIEARRREFAVRAALGASRGRLMRQAITESTLIALAAGALGFATAPLWVRALISFVPPEQMPWLRAETGVTMLIAAIAITSLVTILAGALPVLRGTSLDLPAALARGGRTGSGGAATPVARRLRQAAVIAQLAVSLVLVVCAALLIQTFLRLQRVEPGFSADGRMTLSYFAPRARYQDANALVSLIDRIREEVGQTPGVRAVGVSQALPFSPGAVWYQALTRVDPAAVGNLGELPHVHYNVVSAGYAEALGVPLVSGRTFDATDRASSLPVVVINEALAKRYFANEDPLGKTLWVGHAQALTSQPRRTVIGVIGDARWNGLDEPAGPEAWIPYSQQQPGSLDLLRTMYLVYHASGGADAGAAALMPAIRARIAQADGDLPLTSVRTLTSRLDESVWRQRLAAAALGALGFAALTIALVGIFAVTSYLVGRRAHEMGVRLALGARPRAIVRLVMTESGRLVLIGITLGVGGALAAARLLATLLYGVSASDAPTFAFTAVGLSAAAMLACYLPARRASRVDPLITLRAE